MPYQRKDGVTRSTSVVVDRLLYDEVISRGYSFAEIVNTALSAVLQIDDTFLIRYQVLESAKMRIRDMQSAKRQEEIEADEKKASEKAFTQNKISMGVVLVQNEKYFRVTVGKRHVITTAYEQGRESSARDFWEASVIKFLSPHGYDKTESVRVAEIIARQGFI